MGKSYYLLHPGRAKRQDNTIVFIPSNEEKPKRYLPIEDVENIYCFGHMDINSNLLQLLATHDINIHFFSYHGHYSGSFSGDSGPTSGATLVQQVQHYSDSFLRCKIAQAFIMGAAANMLSVLRYYHRRSRELQGHITSIEMLQSKIHSTLNIAELMGVEGNMRQIYYSAFDLIAPTMKMGKRVRRPPNNEMNALVSFINTLCYTVCMEQISTTALNPTISYLHEPGNRRYSLSLDIAELFKPILVDRLIFSMINKMQIKPTDFSFDYNICYLNADGKRKILEAWEERLSTTIQPSGMDHPISYKQLIKKECHKLLQHIQGSTTYQPFISEW